MSQNEVIIKLIADSKGLTGGMKTASQQVNTFSQNIAQLAQGTLKLHHIQKQAATTQGQFATKTVSTSHLINQAKAAVARLREEKLRMAQIDEVLTKALGEQDAALLKNTGLMQGFAGGAGSASFALLSLTQGVQDAGQFSMGMAQGIRAVNNNVQQFATALMFASAQMGGLSKAIKGMWAALSGPAGILFAFSALTVAIEVFSNRAQRAKKETEELAAGLSDLFSVEGVDGLRGTLEGIKLIEGALESSLSTMAENREAVRQAFLQGGPATIAQMGETLDLIDAQNESMKMLSETTIEKLRSEREEQALINDAYSKTIRLLGVDGVLGVMIKGKEESEKFTSIIERASLIATSGFSSDSEFTQGFNEFLQALRDINPELAITEEKFAKLTATGQQEDFLLAEREKREKELQKLRDERWKATAARLDLMMFKMKQLDKIANKYGADVTAMPVETVGSIAQAIERQKALIEGGVVTSTGELRKDALADMQIGSDMLRMMSDETQSEMAAMAVATEEANRSMGNSFSAWWRKNGEAVNASAKLMSQSIGGVGTAFMQIANRSDGGNEKLFNAGKKFAIASALINTYTGITAALATPNVGPVTRFALAAAVGAQGFAQVAAIRSTTMNGGGGGSSGGGGGASGPGVAPTFFTSFGNASEFPMTAGIIAPPATSQRMSMSLEVSGRSLVGVLQNESSANSRMFGSSSGMYSGAISTSSATVDPFVRGI